MNIVVVIPALNEAAVIGRVVQGLLALRVDDEDKNRDTPHPRSSCVPLIAKVDNASAIKQVIVCDNGSTDNTAQVALDAGATVVSETQRGYGAACLAALAALQQEATAVDIVLFVDGDGSMVAEEAHRLINAIAQGHDLVVGVREAALQQSNALTLPQRVGNHIACWMIKTLWKTKMRDLGPYRAIRFDALQRLGMCDMRFGWTVEMQVKAIQAGLRYDEVPVSTLRRVGKSKISGTVRGVIGAAHGIIGTILKLRWNELRGRGPQRVGLKPLHS